MGSSCNSGHPAWHAPAAIRVPVQECPRQWVSIGHGPDREVQMSDHQQDQVPQGDGSHDDAGSDLAFGMAILKGSVVGLPLMLVFMTVAVWLVTGQDWQTSIVTAILPGVLLGVFGGGFVGMLRVVGH